MGRNTVCFFIKITFSMAMPLKSHPGGEGAVSSAVACFFHPSKTIREKWPDFKKKRLTGMVILGQAECRISHKLVSKEEEFFIHHSNVREDTLCPCLSTIFPSKCWWSLWILFVLFDFIRKRGVCAIINSAKIGEVAYASRIESDVLGTFQDRSILIIDVIASIPTCNYQVLSWNWRSKDPKDLFEDNEHAHTLFLDLVSPLYTWEAQFIFQIVKIAHKIQNCVYITSISSFHYFVSFWAVWLYHIRSSYWGFRASNKMPHLLPKLWKQKLQL